MTTGQPGESDQHRDYVSVIDTGTVVTESVPEADYRSEYFAVEETRRVVITPGGDIVANEVYIDD